MNPEKQRLIHDLMNDGGEEARHAETLLAGGRILHRRRRWRMVRRGLAMSAVLSVATVGVLRFVGRETAVSTASLPATPRASPEFQVRSLTDDELLALFPNTPVGLATLSNGKKRLIFPRPGDEEQFITRL